MSSLDELAPGSRVNGVDPSGPVEVVAVSWHGTQAVTLTYRNSAQQVQERMLFRGDEGTFTVADGHEVERTLPGATYSGSLPRPAESNWHTSSIPMSL